MRALIVSFALFTLPGISPTFAGSGDLAPGKFLVASRTLQSSVFGESVVLLLEYGQRGSIGLIINRPMQAKPADALPQFDSLQEYQGSLYLGGPVAVRTLRALLRVDEPPEKALEVINGVYLTTLDDKLLETADVDASRLRLYVGYAGWSAGQLEAEIARGDWHVRPADSTQVFAESPAEIWRQLVPPVTYSVGLQSPADAPAL